ncbi:unnamed protein product, partial [Mycena citricolor]
VSCRRVADLYLLTSAMLGPALRAMRGLPISLLLILFALACAALPVQTAQLKPPLTPDNFHSTIAKGVWFIEHFSPYCGHCRAFAPTWERLVEYSESSKGVSLAQVDCSVHGDLCNDNGVKGYPQMNLYKDGEFVERFKGNRDYDILTAFIDKAKPSAPEPIAAAESVAAAAAVSSPSPEPLLNPNGEVRVLNPDNFHAVLEEGPTFVKFYAPWCGHCKKLAPIWKQLAKISKGKMNIAEVDCEAHDKFCKTQDIPGFPTLMFYPPTGVKSEYTMGRKLEQLKAFVDKASSSATQAIQPEELEAKVLENPATYLLLYSENDTRVIKTVTKYAAPLLGSPIIFTSSSPTLWKRFSVPESAPWAIVALKDRDPHSVAAMYLGNASPKNDLSDWLLANRLPTSMELVQDTFQSIMNAPHKPLVVIAAVTSKTESKVIERLRDIGLKWRVRTGGTGMYGGRSVVFTWMDIEKWEKWMKSMYGLQKSASDEAEDAGIVITDHQILKYYNRDQSGALIKLASPSIFSALEGAVSGSISPNNSENFMERVARFLNGKMTGIEGYVIHHPIYSLGFAVVSVFLVYLALRRFLADDYVDRDHAYGKSGRLD